MRENDNPSDWQRLRYVGIEHAVDGEAVLFDEDRTWFASVDSPLARVPRISLRHEPVAPSFAKPHGLPTAPNMPGDAAISTFVGTSPSLILLDRRKVGLLYRTVVGKDCVLLFRRLKPGSHTWSRPVRVDDGDGLYSVGNNKLVRLRSGRLIVPAVRWVKSADGLVSQPVCFVSDNKGRTWQRTNSTGTGWGILPAAAPTANGLVLVSNRAGSLVRSVSTDEGESWSAPEPLGIAAMPTPHALYAADSGDTLTLVWTEAMPPEASAPPRIQSLLTTTSVDDGRRWAGMRRLVTRPGHVPFGPAVAIAGDQLELLFEQREGGDPGAQRVVVQRSGIVASLGPNSYLDEPESIREALLILVAHTLARPERARFLFVETYFMRALVHAHRLLASHPELGEAWLDTRVGLEQAIAFADSQVKAQEPTGYWPIGYPGILLADMATLVGLFHSLEGFVEPARYERYTHAAERFVERFRKDGLLYASGGVGAGFSGAATPDGRRYDIRRPFLVATALAGVEAHAWLYQRTGETKYLETARAGLDFLLSHVNPDGSIEGFETETPLWGAVYVQEGLMAADLMLQDPTLRERMRPVLARHVDWVLQFQRPDGSWDTGVAGERLRTVLLVNFLLWYDQAVQAREDVRQAIRRSGPAFGFDYWKAHHYYDADHEVLRALGGIALLALSEGKFVF